MTTTAATYLFLATWIMVVILANYLKRDKPKQPQRKKRKQARRDMFYKDEKGNFIKI